MADQYTQLGGIAGNIGAQPVTTTGTITGGTITATTAFTSTTGYIGIGSAVATSGQIRTVHSSDVLVFRNGGGSNAKLLSIDGSNNVTVGDGSAAANVSGIYITCVSTGTIGFSTGLTSRMSLTSTGLTLQNSAILTMPTGAVVRSGTGTPEGVVTAPVGSLFLRSDGGAGTTLYIKESGTGNTGWIAK